MIRKDDADATAMNPEHKPAFRINRALECIGNPDSVGNCRRTLVDMEIEGASGETYPLPLFQHPLAPANFREAEARQPWSMARWLLMLLAWPRLLDGEPGVTKLGEWEHGRFRLGACVDGRTRRDIIAILKERNLELANPDDQAVGQEYDDAWVSALIRSARNVVGEGFAWNHALDAWVLRSGVHYCWDVVYDADGSGRVFHELRFFASGRGGPSFAAARIIPLRDGPRLAGVGYRHDDKPWSEVRQDNNVTNLQVVRDFGAIVSKARIVGGANEYEVTTGGAQQGELEGAPMFVPLWGYTANSDWDVDPLNGEAVAAALAKVGQIREANEWAKKYDLRGPFHYDGENRYVGRWWGLPDVGDRTSFARPFGKFREIYYKVTDLSNFRLGEIPSELQGNPPMPAFEAGKHFLRGRPFGPGVTSDDGETIAPLVEASYDSGATWESADAWARLDARAARILIQTPDLRAIRSFDDSTGYVEAYIRGRLRLRVTGTIQGDACGDTLGVLSHITLSRRERCKVMLRRPSFQTRVREDRASPQGITFYGGNSQFRQTSRDRNERWDDDAVRGSAVHLLRHQDRVRTRATLTMPGIVLYRREGGVEYGYRPGDFVKGIQAAYGFRDQTIRFDANLAEPFAVIAKIEHRYTRDLVNDRLEASTILTLEDPSVLTPEFEGVQQ